MLKSKHCCITGLTGFEAIDMHKFREKLSSNQIDLNYLNQCLKPDSEFSMEGIQLDDSIDDIDEDSKSKNLRTHGTFYSKASNNSNKQGTFYSKASNKQGTFYSKTSNNKKPIKTYDAEAEHE